MATRHKYRFPDRITAEVAYANEKEKNLLLYWFIREFHLGRIKVENGIPAYANVESRYAEENTHPETWTATVYKFFTPAGNERGIICYSLGGSSFGIGDLDDTLVEWDANGANINNSYYSTYWNLAKSVREALNAPKNRA